MCFGLGPQTLPGPARQSSGLLTAWESPRQSREGTVGGDVLGGLPAPGVLPEPHSNAPNSSRTGSVSSPSASPLSACSSRLALQLCLWGCEPARLCLGHTRHVH